MGPSTDRQGYDYWGVIIFGSSRGSVDRKRGEGRREKGSRDEVEIKKRKSKSRKKERKDKSKRKGEKKSRGGRKGRRKRSNGRKDSWRQQYLRSRNTIPFLLFSLLFSSVHFSTDGFSLFLRGHVGWMLSLQCHKSTNKTSFLISAFRALFSSKLYSHLALPSFISALALPSFFHAMCLKLFSVPELKASP